MYSCRKTPFAQCVHNHYGEIPLWCNIPVWYFLAKLAIFCHESNRCGRPTAITSQTRRKLIEIELNHDPVNQRWGWKQQTPRKSKIHGRTNLVGNFPGAATWHTMNMDLMDLMMPFVNGRSSDWLATICWMRLTCTTHLRELVRPVPIPVASQYNIFASDTIPRFSTRRKLVWYEWRPLFYGDSTVRHGPGYRAIANTLTNDVPLRALVSITTITMRDTGGSSVQMEWRFLLSWWIQLLFESHRFFVASH